MSHHEDHPAHYAASGQKLTSDVASIPQSVIATIDAMTGAQPMGGIYGLIMWILCLFCFYWICLYSYNPTFLQSAGKISLAKVFGMSLAFMAITILACWFLRDR